MNVYKTKLEESAIIITIISIIFLVIGNYTLFILFLLLNLSSAFNFFNRGLVNLSIDIDNREVSYIAYKKFKITKSNFSLNSDTISYKFHTRSTGINNFKELILYNKKNIIFKDNMMNIRNLKNDEKESIVKILSDYKIKKN